MNFETLKKDIAIWVKSVLPIEIRWNTGTFTGGHVSVTVGTTTVSQDYVTSVDVTLSALSVKIAAIPGVMNVVYDYTNKVITFLSMGSFLVTTVNRSHITGTMLFTVPAPPIFIWEDQKAPRPSTLYIAGKITIVNSIGQDYIAAPNAQGIVKITGNREMNLSLQSFGDGALSLLSSLKNASLRECSRSSLAYIGLIVIDDRGLSDISTLLDSRIETRALLEWRLRTSEEITDAPGIIETVEITEFIKDENNTLITLDTITINKY